MWMRRIGIQSLMKPSTGLRSLSPPITTVPPLRTICMAWTTVTVEADAASITTSTPPPVRSGCVRRGRRGADVDGGVGAEPAGRGQAQAVGGGAGDEHRARPRRPGPPRWSASPR